MPESLSDAPTLESITPEAVVPETAAELTETTVAESGLEYLPLKSLETVTDEDVKDLHATLAQTWNRTMQQYNSDSVGERWAFKDEKLLYAVARRCVEEGNDDYKTLDDKNIEAFTTKVVVLYTEMHKANSKKLPVEVKARSVQEGQEWIDQKGWRASWLLDKRDWDNAQIEYEKAINPKGRLTRTYAGDFKIKEPMPKAGFRKVPKIAYVGRPSKKYAEELAKNTKKIPANEFKTHFGAVYNKDRLTVNNQGASKLAKKALFETGSIKEMQNYNKMLREFNSVTDPDTKAGMLHQMWYISNLQRKADGEPTLDKKAFKAYLEKTLKDSSADTIEIAGTRPIAGTTDLTRPGLTPPIDPELTIPSDGLKGEGWELDHFVTVLLADDVGADLLTKTSNAFPKEGSAEEMLRTIEPLRLQLLARMDQMDKATRSSTDPLNPRSIARRVIENPKEFANWFMDYKLGLRGKIDYGGVYETAATPKPTIELAQENPEAVRRSEEIREFFENNAVGKEAVKNLDLGDAEAVARTSEAINMSPGDFINSVRLYRAINDLVAGPDTTATINLEHTPEPAPPDTPPVILEGKFRDVPEPVEVQEEPANRPEPAKVDFKTILNEEAEASEARMTSEIPRPRPFNDEQAAILRQLSTNVTTPQEAMASLLNGNIATPRQTAIINSVANGGLSPEDVISGEVKFTL